MNGSPQPDADPRPIGRVALLACCAGALAVLAVAAWLGREQAYAIGAGGAPAPSAAAAAAAASAAAAAAPSVQLADGNRSPGAKSQATWPLWEFRLRQPIPPRDPSLTPPGWRLIGAAQSGGQWRLIVQTQGKPEPQFLKVGDPLPGGHRIVAITEEDVTLQRGAQQLVLSYIGY